MSKRKSDRNTMPKERKEFEEEVIAIDRVTRVVKGGRRLRFRATVAIGDKQGRVGIGTGKSNEVTGAISKAITKAKKTLIRVPIINGTIPHEIKYKFKAAKILLMPAAPGTGLIVGGSVRKVVGLAGVTNILGKSFGSNNKLSSTRAAFEALKRLQENPFIKAKEVSPKNELTEAVSDDKTADNSDDRKKQKAVVEEKAKKTAVKHEKKTEAKAATKEAAPAKEKNDDAEKK